MSVDVGVVTITYRERPILLQPGDSVAIGRSRHCEIALPAGDDYFSRKAALLHVLTDCLLVRNESRSKPFVIRPAIGEDRLVEPGAATTSLPFLQFNLIFAGRGGVAACVGVDTRRLIPPVRAFDGLATVAKDTVTAPIRLTAAQRRLLVSLCRPLLTQSGPAAVPSTYGQISAELELSAGYVRQAIRILRETLAGHGVPGLSGDADGELLDDYRWPLARWAIHNGWVTREDVNSAQ